MDQDDRLRVLGEWYEARVKEWVAVIQAPTIRRCRERQAKDARNKPPKLCNECGEVSAFAICAECSEKHVAVTHRLSVSNNSRYGYRLTKGFVMMHYSEDEYVFQRLSNRRNGKWWILS